MHVLSMRVLCCTPHPCTEPVGALLLLSMHALSLWMLCHCHPTHALSRRVLCACPPPPPCAEHVGALLLPSMHALSVGVLCHCSPPMH